MTKPKPQRKRVAGAGNTAYIQAMMGLRRSSASSRHTPKPRKGTRRAKSAAAIKDHL